MVAAERLVPESPMIHTGFPSPDLRRTESSSSRSHPPPRFLSDPSPATLAPLLQASQAESDSAKGKGNDLRTRVILRHALKWAVERVDIDLLGWLVGLTGPYASILDDEADALEDEDGWGVLGISIQNSCGRQEQEESVRLLVGRWGVSIGPRGGTDRQGWTPLHLAALISTPPLISFLLNRGASPHALTSRGLTPLDLVSGIPERADIAVFLEHSASVPMERPEAAGTSLSARRSAMLSRRRARAAARLRKMDAEERVWHVTREKENWVRDMAAVVEVSPELLLPDTRSGRHGRRSHDSRDSGMNDNWRDEVEEEEESEVDEAEEVGGGGDIDGNDSMLVFSLTNLPTLLDILITTYRPVCSPVVRRSVPANALYLHARFALLRCDDTWLEELLEGAVERIEQGVYGNAEDLAYLAFWAYNTTTLLHLLRSDAEVGPACEELNLLGMIEELISAIHVFIIRVAERRIDLIYDAALLDYETLEDFNDVRFEGEWTLFRSFAGKKRREVLPKASQIFSNTNSPNPNGGMSTFESSPSGLLGALRDNVAAASPLKTLASRASIQDLRGHAPRSTSIDSLATIGNSGGDGISPRQITDILSSVLMVLQLYEVNPAITIQAFSQVFFWIACELFNRVLTRKKYLCRSKAVQIRMNITVLEDWVRANGLPTQTATKYFEPVNQLLRWLQCLSSVRDFDTVIGTMQNLRNLNPLQMRRAVREYRYEVNEGRMTEECGQYLAQLQKDWEKRRVQLVEAHHRGATDETVTSSSVLDPVNDNSTSIDGLFDGTTSLADWVPGSAPECYGELLDPRHMLPFLLPENTEFLVATPPTDAAFANANLSAVYGDGGKMSRSGSRSSFASTRPMGWALPDARKLRRLPRDFFGWLKEREAERRHRGGRGHARQRPSEADRAHEVEPGNGEGDAARRVGEGTRSDARDAQGLDAVREDEDDRPARPSQAQLQHQQQIFQPHQAYRSFDGPKTAPLYSSPFPPNQPNPAPHTPQPSKLNPGMPSPHPGLRTSQSIDQLRHQAKMSFGAVTATRSHERGDSFELKQRHSISVSGGTARQAGDGVLGPASASAPVERLSASPRIQIPTTASLAMASGMDSTTPTSGRRTSASAHANGVVSPTSPRGVSTSAEYNFAKLRKTSGPLSPDSESEGAGGKKRWWKVGRTVSSGSVKSVGSGTSGTSEGRGRREDSVDTVVG